MGQYGRYTRMGLTYGTIYHGGIINANASHTINANERAGLPIGEIAGAARITLVLGTPNTFTVTPLTVSIAAGALNANEIRVDHFDMITVGTAQAVTDLLMITVRWAKEDYTG